MKKIFLFHIALFLFLSGFSQTFTTAKGGHCFTLDVPNYMTKTFSLNDEASLQYQNTVKDAYVVVIVDYKEELDELGMKFVNARDFLDFFTKDYKKEAKTKKLSSVVEFTANGNTHAQSELLWEEDDKDGIFSGYMLITAVETKGHFYKILCWTVSQNKDLVKDDFKKTAKSLKD